MSARSCTAVMADEDQKITNDSNQTQLQEEYLKNLEQLEEGQLIEGRVIEVGPEQIFIDVGYKSEGKIPLSEFDTPPKIGDIVHVILISKETREGDVVVSKKQADGKIFWKNLRQAFQDHKPVDGVFAKSIKGGYEVDLGYGVRAFTPLSKADIAKIEDPEKLVGMKSKFYVERLYNENKINIILSRREWLEEELTRKRNEFFEKVNIGDVVEGSVKSFTSFGAFIDLGGFDGLLHINDMSWGHVTRPKEKKKKGETIKFKVIRLDKEEKKINLSLKHFSDDPWNSFEKRYKIGDVIKGRVTKLTDFGAFVELEEGIEGLVHVSELSWVKRVKHPKELMKIGDEVEAKILAYDLQQKRVSLGVKQVIQNPWEHLDEKYPIGMRLKRPVRRFINSGAFIELEEGIDGFLHIDDLSWTKKYKHPSALLHVDEEIEVIVIDMDKENHKIRLGLKQLSEDPWRSLSKAYHKGSVIEGTISSITDFGIFVKVQGDIEGLILKNNLSDSRDEAPEKAIAKYQVGDTIKAVITEVHPESQKLSLSVREFIRKQQRVELEKYIHDEEEESTITIGDFLKDTENKRTDS